MIALVNQIWKIGLLLLFFQHGQADSLTQSNWASASGAFYLWAAAGIKTKTIAFMGMCKSYQSHFHSQILKVFQSEARPKFMSLYRYVLLSTHDNKCQPKSNQRSAC